jgi:enoyl-CoA hydratase/carnithine racemase
VLDAAVDLAGRIAANAPLAVQRTRSLMVGLTHTSDEEAFAAAATGLMELMGTDDFNEGITAFIEKRPPQWKGR